MKTIAPSGKVYQAGTYSGNPVSVTAALETLKFLHDKRESIYPEMENKCKEIVRRLGKVIDEHDLRLQINHVASMFQLFFTEKPVYDYKTAKAADNKKFMLYQRRLLDNGIFIPPSQWETCFLSSEHSEQDIEKTIEVAQETIDQLKDSKNH